jgi:hypothetical protein
MGEVSDSNDYEYSTSDDDAEYSWIGWFCSRKGHEFFCEVSGPALCGVRWIRCATPLLLWRYSKNV